MNIVQINGISFFYLRLFLISEQLVITSSEEDVMYGNELAPNGAPYLNIVVDIAITHDPNKSMNDCQRYFRLMTSIRRWGQMSRPNWRSRQTLAIKSMCRDVRRVLDYFSFLLLNRVSA